MVKRTENRRILILILTLIFFAGAGVRFLDFSNPPLDFHPARQLHSALIARGFYLDAGGSLPGLDPLSADAAKARGESELWIEPPIMEFLAAKLYGLAGDADLRLPRMLAIVFWLCGGLALVRFCQRRLSPAGTAAAAVVFLWLPYGVLVSRSFQPESLMILLTVFAIGSFQDWIDTRSWRAAVLSGLFAGAAIFVKQVMIFPLGLAFVFGALSAAGSLRNALRSAQLWTIALFALGPVAAYNVWGLWIDGFLRQQYQGRFLFSQWLSVGFYIRWLREIDKVFGIWLIVAALIGIALIRSARTRLIWTGYLAGYVVYGFMLPHHIGTHDYYQVPLFPLAAFGFGALAERISVMVKNMAEPRRIGRFLIAAAVVFGCGWMILDTATRLGRVDYRSRPDWYRETARRYDPYPDQINVIGIMDDYGAGMMYWGLRTPMIWDRTVAGLPEEAAEAAIRAAMNDRQFLIVTDLERFYRQPRLQAWLGENAELVESGGDFLIYRIENGDDAPEGREF